MKSPKRLHVDLGARSYEILIGPGLLEKSGEILRQRGIAGKALVVTNPTVGRLYLEVVAESLREAGFTVRSLLIPDGEEYKALSQVERVYDEGVNFRLERGSLMVALGGGVIGDLTGFAAATFLRGVKFVQIPTTLLAQVDSSVGGKVAVNHRDGKNLIGAFYQPAVVIADLRTLETLDEREFKSGLAEIIKAGLIRDASLFTCLEERAGEIKARETPVLTDIIYRACQIKVEVVEADEFDAGVREILNYGHTIGHALEAETGYTQYRHGEAVAVGMLGAAVVGEMAGYVAPGVKERIAALLQDYGLPLEIPGIPAERLLNRMSMDKKVRQERIRFILPAEIGKVIVVDDLPREMILRALRRLGASGGEID